MTMPSSKKSSKTSLRSRRAPRTIHGRCVRVDLSYILDMGRDFHVSGLPHEVVGLKDDVGGLILRGLVHSSTPFRVRYELGDIKLVPSSIKLVVKAVRGKKRSSKRS
jgi:hypothetical protein